ncbi:hypothetical protein Tco_0647920 [Tanacetum coccineum]
MISEEQIDTEINYWFEQTMWDEAEREISPDEVLGKEEEEKLSFGEKMAYKSYLSTKPNVEKAEQRWVTCSSSNSSGLAAGSSIDTKVMSIGSRR